MKAEYILERGIEEWLDVTRWPRWARRCFILTLPASGPLYVCAFFAAIVAGIVWYLAAILFDTWK